MAEIGRVERPDAAINAPEQFGRVVSTGDRQGRQHHEQPAKEDSLDLHAEDEGATDEAPPAAIPIVPPSEGLDLAI
jgi:hypothetical protein